MHPEPPRVTMLIGVNLHDASGDAGHRQAVALRALQALHGVVLVNVQWSNGIFEIQEVPTLAVLREDSRSVSGRRGARKPLTNQAFDALCEEAEKRDLEYFCFTNSDVQVLQPLVDLVVRDPRDGFAISRVDTCPSTGRDLNVTTTGMDTFIIRVNWWKAHRHRFRPYIIGEPVWDNVYAAVLCSHGDARILNRDTWTRHVYHGRAWSGSPFAEYTRLLATLDAEYFSLWARYHAGLSELRTAGATEDEEHSFAAAVFRQRPGFGRRLWRSARGAKAWIRFWRSRYLGTRS